LKLKLKLKLKQVSWAVSDLNLNLQLAGFGRLSISGLPHGPRASVAASGRGACFAFARGLLLASSSGSDEVTRLDECDEGRVLQGLVGHLSRLAGAEKELFSSGKGHAERGFGLVGDVHVGGGLLAERGPRIQARMGFPAPSRFALWN
jgi:hypothetical protein